MTLSITMKAVLISLIIFLYAWMRISLTKIIKGQTRFIPKLKINFHVDHIVNLCLNMISCCSFITVSLTQLPQKFFQMTSTIYVIWQGRKCLKQAWKAYFFAGQKWMLVFVSLIDVYKSIVCIPCLLGWLSKLNFQL